MADTVVTAKFRADTSDLQSKLGQVQGSLTATAAKIETLNGKMQAVGASMAAAGKTMTVGVTLPLAAIGAASTKLAMDFDSSMTKIVSLVGIGADEVDGMKQSVLGLSGETGKSAQELADALFVVTSAGLRGQDALNALESAAKAGAAGLGETNDIARSVAGAMNAYGPAVLDAARATDIIVATARAGNFETSQFAGALGDVLPFAKQAGASLEDVGGSVALLTRTNGDAAKSVTQMAALFRAFVVPAEEAKKELAAAGLSASDMRDRISKEGLAGALQFLDTQLGGNREQLGKLLGSSEAAAAAFQILDSDAQTLNDTFGVVTDSVGMTGEAFDTTAETAGFKMQQAMTSIQNSMIQLGDVILPIVAAVADKISMLTGLFASLPGPVKTSIVVFGGVVAALGPILWIGGKIMTTLATMGKMWAILSTKVRLATLNIATSVKSMELRVKTAMIGANTQMGALVAGARVMSTGVVGAFRTVGTAAKGLVASLGPIGIALVGITVAYEVFSGQQADTEAKVQSLTDAMKEQQGVMGAATVQQLTQAFLDLEYAGANAGQTVRDDLEALGFTIDDVVVATLEGEDAWVALTQQMMTASAGNKELEAAFSRINGVMRNNYQRVQEAKTEYDNYQTSVAVAERVTGGMTDATGDMVDAFSEAPTVLDEVHSGVQKISDIFLDFDANVAAIRAKDEFRKTLQGLDDAVAENNRSLTKWGTGAMQNREAVLDALTKARGDAEAWGAANGKTAEQVERRFQKNTETLRATLAEQGFSQQEIQEFFGEKWVDTAGVAVGTSMSSEIGNIADRVGTAAFREFKGVGIDAMNGMTLGFKIGTPNVTSGARESIRAAEAAARSEAESDSPSRLFARVGSDLAEGLRVGIEDKKDPVARAMQAIVRHVRDIGITEEDRAFFAQAGRDLSDSLAEAIKGNKDNVEQATREAFVDWYDRIRGELKDKLSQAKQDFRDFAKSVSNTVMGALNFGTAQSETSQRAKAIADAQKAYNEAAAAASKADATDVDRKSLVDAREDLDFAKWQGEMLGTTFLDGLRAQAAQAAEFAAKVKQLIQMGLSEAALQQVLESGVVAGTAIADELIAGGATAIDDTNKLVESTQLAADEVGLLAAQNFKQTGIDSAEATLNGFKEQFGKDGPGRKKLMGLMDRLANAMNRTATITVTTVHRSETEDGGTVPKRALGGPVQARQAYIVGERGPELFIPGAFGNIIPNNAIMAPQSPITPVNGGGGAVIHNQYSINIQSLAGDKRQIGREVVEAIKAFEKSSGPVFQGVTA